MKILKKFGIEDADNTVVSEVQTEEAQFKADIAGMEASIQALEANENKELSAGLEAFNDLGTYIASKSKNPEAALEAMGMGNEALVDVAAREALRIKSGVKMVVGAVVDFFKRALSLESSTKKIAKALKDKHKIYLKKFEKESSKIKIDADKEYPSYLASIAKAFTAPVGSNEAAVMGAKVLSKLMLNNSTHINSSISDEDIRKVVPSLILTTSLSAHNSKNKIGTYTDLHKLNISEYKSESNAIISDLDKDDMEADKYRNAITAGLKNVLLAYTDLEQFAGDEKVLQKALGNVTKLQSALTKKLSEANVDVKTIFGLSKTFTVDKTEITNMSSTELNDKLSTLNKSKQDLSDITASNGNAKPGQSDNKQKLIQNINNLTLELADFVLVDQNDHSKGFKREVHSTDIIVVEKELYVIGTDKKVDIDNLTTGDIALGCSNCISLISKALKIKSIDTGRYALLSEKIFTEVDKFLSYPRV